VHSFLSRKRTYANTHNFNSVCQDAQVVKMVVSAMFYNVSVSSTINLNGIINRTFKHVYLKCKH
jgi:hypothetical protein